MIPKIIHYCWFGGNPLPDLVLACIESWKANCPEYSIMRWDENSFDVNSEPFVSQAYQRGDWAFVSDYVRLHALSMYGGIYLDTDIELHQSLDPLLKDDCFTGFEVRDTVAAGIIGSIKGHQVIRQLFAYYQGRNYIENGVRIVETSPILLTNVLKKYGLKLNGKNQLVCGCRIYEKRCFYPTGLRWLLWHFSSKTICIHHYMDSWRTAKVSQRRSFSQRLRLSFVFMGRQLFGTESMYYLGQRLRK